MRYKNSHFKNCHYCPHFADKNIVESILDPRFSHSRTSALHLYQGLQVIFHQNDGLNSTIYMLLPVLCSAESLQLCLSLCDPMHCSPPGSSVHGDSPGCHALLQGIFPTQVSNPGLLHCRQFLYHLSHQENPHLFMGKLIWIWPVNLSLKGMAWKSM